MPRSVTVRDVQGAAVTSSNPFSVSGAVTVNNSGASPVPVSGTISVASSPSTPVYTNPPTTTPVTPAAATITAGQDNTVALGQTCKKYFIQNNLASAKIHFTIDGTAAGLGSPAIASGGAYYADSMQTSAIHIYPEGTGSVALNTAATAGVWVQAGA